MSLSDVLLQTCDVELGMTGRALARVPVDRATWTPHPKSMPLGRLAMHVATLPAMATAILTTDVFDVTTMPPRDLTLRGTEDLLATFEREWATAREALAAASDGHLQAHWRFTAGTHVLSDNSRAFALLHMFLGHLIHHRAQFGTYLRLLDLPVPAVYGPSADEPR